jgi:hypothetical protein
LPTNKRDAAIARRYVLVGSALVGAALLGFVYLFSFTSFLGTLIQ